MAIQSTQQDRKDSESDTMTKAEELYSDILHMKRSITAVSIQTQPRIPHEERAKIFLSFDTLRGFSDTLDDREDRLLLRQRIEQTEESAAAVMEKLQQLQQGISVTVIYFLPDSMDSDMGSYVKMTGVIRFVDLPFRMLCLSCGEECGFQPAEAVIRLDDILDVWADEVI